VSAAKSGAAGPSTGPRAAATDPDLLRVIEAWGDLPDHIKSAVLALIFDQPGTKI
jgi:hypothetical protein